METKEKTSKINLDYNKLIEIALDTFGNDVNINTSRQRRSFGINFGGETSLSVTRVDECYNILFVDGNLEERARKLAKAYHENGFETEVYNGLCNLLL